jgi:hypothetical protein
LQQNLRLDEVILVFQSLLQIESRRDPCFHVALAVTLMKVDPFGP